MAATGRMARRDPRGSDCNREEVEEGGEEGSSGQWLQQGGGGEEGSSGQWLQQGGRGEEES